MALRVLVLLELMLMLIGLAHLSPAAEAMTPPPPPSPARQFNELVDYLQDNDGTSLLGALALTGLDAALLNAVKAGVKVTILAPGNDAFANNIKPGCRANITRTLLNHVIPQRLPASAVLAAPVRAKLATLGPNKVTKFSQNPLRVVIRRGMRRAFARVVTPDAFVRPAIVVHKLNRVLVFC